MPPTFAKSPPELVERFRAVLARFPEATQKQMFGFPAAFVGGNLVTGLFNDRWHVRLGGPELDEALAQDGGGAFEPMAGRPMRGYALLPVTIADDPDAAAAWVAKAIAFGRTLPPKKG